MGAPGGGASGDRCPGQDLRLWKPEDICYVRCAGCGGEVEIWKDEPVRRCPSCGKPAKNPRLDPGCGAWCPHASECQGLGGPPPSAAGAAETL